jgi:hypothetical protein
MASAFLAAPSATIRFMHQTKDTAMASRASGIDSDMAWAMVGLVADGEVLGMSADGLVIFWDGTKRAPYKSGASASDLDAAALGVLERERLCRDGWKPEPAPGLQA